jgi:type VI secretion system protein ImpL
MLIKVLVACLVFLSLMLIGLVWLVAVLAKITLWLPGGVTACFFLTIVGVVAFRYLKARKASRGLEDALRSQARQQAMLTRPDLQLDVERMREEFDKAVSALKSSRLGTAGRDALYYLPWYTIIGPPGAGKSTALRNSGLRFPHLSDSGGGVKGLGGTRNCDWWLTNQAVVLDTAGRWATQEEDHDEWLAFLAMVRKHRPKKPLNGLITAISVGDIVNAREDEVEALARRMRERVDEVIGTLHVALPVYVLFTKCDLVEGFVEMFGDLKRIERDQTWGFTAPLAEAVKEPGSYFDQRFAELAGVLESRSLGRMSEERSVARRQRIYAFPQQFVMMRRNLSTFLKVLFEANVYKETPSMRGVYFTSGTQEGRPFSLLLNRLVEAMGVKDRVGDAEPIVDQKSYFLHDVFMQVIFEDRDVASASEAELRRQRVRRLVLTAVLTLVAAAFSIVPGYAWQENAAQLRETSNMVERWERAAAHGAAQATSAEQVLALGPITKNLATYSVETPRWLTTLGMYQGDKVRPHLRRYHANLLRRELVQPMIARDVQAMTDFGFRYEALPDARPNADEQALHYRLLKTHLVLSAPKSPAEPPYEPSKKWLEGELASRWGASQPSLDAASKQSIRSMAATYSEYMAEYSELSFTRDKDVVRRTRMALTRVPFAEQALERIIALSAQDGYELTLERLIGRSPIQSSSAIRGAFTRRGWENRVRSMFDASVLDHAGELWVLGLADGDQGAERQLKAQLAELSSLYFSAYIDEWQSFLRGLRIEAPTSNEASLAMLRDLTRGQPPALLLLMQRVHGNVALKPKEEKKDLVESTKEGALGAIRDKLGAMLGDEKAAAIAGAIAPGDPPGRPAVTAADVTRAFEAFTGFGVPPDTGDEGPRPSVPYDAYHEQIYYVRDGLQMQQDNPEERDQLVTKLQAARVRVRALIDEQNPAFRPVFEQLLWPPIEGASATSSASMAGSISSHWCTEVVVPFERALRGSYPFEQTGHDLSLDELTQFYLPDKGILWTFVKDALSRTVELEGDKYMFAKHLGEDGSKLYSTRLLEFLQRSRDVASVFFPQGSATPQVDFEVRINPSPDVAITTMSVGGSKIEYHNGPEKWELLSWPGKQPAMGASIQVRGANGMNERISQEDAWGLFRMLEAGTVTRSSSRTFTVAWQLQTHDVTLKVDFRPTRGESPFFGLPGQSNKPVFLDPVRTPAATAPKVIVTGGKPCNL